MGYRPLGYPIQDKGTAAHNHKGHLLFQTPEHESSLFISIQQQLS